MQRLLSAAGIMVAALACTGARPAGHGGTDARGEPGASVRPGIEVLLSDSVALLDGARTGLVSNQGGVDAAGVHDVERLLAAGINLVALFSPEHGFRGTARPGESVANTTDPRTGLPIYSLYGRTASPTADMLNGLDIILIDLPDAGARYFTYLGTTINVMREAARHDIHVIVLDRPNPIGGAVQGNVLDTEFRSFVGSLAVPMRHGLTLGELALLARSDLGISTRLTVVPVQGWNRAESLDQTGLPFIRPSPNLPTLESLFHYPGLCLFEGTTLSVGRGSNAPFEQIGSPWLDTAWVLEAMREAELPGVRFESVTFTPHSPGDGKYADTLLSGIRLRVTDRAEYDPTLTAVHLLAAVISRHGRNENPGGRRFAWLPSFTRLAGTDELQRSLESGASPEEATAGWGDARERFLERSENILLYPRP